MKNLIRKYALQNAIKFEGKANPGAVIGKVLSENPKLKSKIKNLSKEINQIVNEINSLSLDEQKQEFEKFASEIKEKKHEEKGLPEFKNKKNVQMRFEPSPSGALHVGHAYVLSLNSEYCRKYKGKLFLRIGDTNPENIYEPAYKLIEEDAKWLTNNNISEIIYQSDRLPIYYKYMEKLINLGKAYICLCNPDSFKELKENQETCPCRNKKDQKQRWEKMFKEYKQGEAVARLKTNLKDKNPAMRDFPLFRINDSSHPKTKKKFRVWPLMNMAVSVDDIEFGMTHVIRAKDHNDNAKRQEIIFNYLGKKFHEALFVGRINFTGMPISATKTRQAIEQKKYTGWDDIRLPFLPALRKRGYQPETFIKYALDVGMSLNDKTVSSEEFFKTLNAFNKDIIDSASFRYFFVENPKLIKIENAPKQNLELDLHPDNKKGGRKFTVEDELYISNEDYKKLKNNHIYRLMDCLNFYKKDNKFVFDSLEYEKYKNFGSLIMHWLPKKDNVKVEVLMPDNKVKKGIGEKTLSKVKMESVIQFTRIGFCRLNSKEKNKHSFWYAHD